jgi:hypothetical protein
MRILKVIAGSACLFVACFLGLFAWVSFISGEPWFTLVPIAFIIGLISIGLLLILRQGSPLSSLTRGLIVVFFALLILAPVALDLWIRYDRRELQKRSQQFLARPIPKLLIPDSQGYVAGYYVDTNSGPANGVFGYSLILIERYATKGRIRWSARIQGQFACTGEGVNPNIRSDAIGTNEEVRTYLAERNAILAKEWRMGFWQWVEDTIEMKGKIPEHEEEDYHPTGVTSSVPQ